MLQPARNQVSTVPRTGLVTNLESVSGNGNGIFHPAAGNKSKQTQAGDHHGIGLGLSIR